MTISILLVDDHRMVRQGLGALVCEQADMKIVGEADSGREAVSMAHELQPDLVILDISMPDMNGIEAARRILAGCSHTKVMALSMHADKRFVAEMLKTGASGYLLKSSVFSDLVRAIRSVMNGNTYLSPELTEDVVKGYLNQLEVARDSTLTVLSGREREVLQLIAEGRTSKEIATALDVSVRTVETHRRQIMSKLDIHTVAGLTKLAIKEGLTSLDH